jgi:hypothetical protein
MKSFDFIGFMETYTLSNFKVDIEHESGAAAHPDEK